MSGRLVILRHKSWNVWNQDNREKVLRDQRLHQEEVSRKVEQEKKNSQELNLEILKSTAVDSSSAGRILRIFIGLLYIKSFVSQVIK
jgi:hypothetical protein